MREELLPPCPLERKMELKVIVFETNPLILEVFKELETHHNLVYVEELLSRDNAGEHEDANIICVDQSVLDAGLIERFRKLEMIAVRSTGYDHIDTGFCREKGIPVSNVPGYAANAVAEHTFALLLALCRHIEPALAYTRTGRFSWDGLQGFELLGKTMAVIGTGTIGKRVAELARALGMTVKAYDLKPDEAWAGSFGIDYVGFDAAIQCADVVSLNVPLAHGSGYLIGGPQFKMMKQGVVLINTARGELVDPKALVMALHDGQVAAAGLDVLPHEHYIREKEKNPDEFFSGRFDLQNMLANTLLYQHSNVLVTPHIGWYTKEADRRALDITVANILSFASGKDGNIVTL